MGADQRRVFQSVTPQHRRLQQRGSDCLSQPAQLLIILLMLVGGSPGSTAGGFKTTTLAVMLLGIRAVFRHKERPQCFGRRIADESIRNASAIFLLYLLLFLTGGI